ncbi:MAG: hypothetical protein QMC67_06285 [Candidatus Wallbacteria bacterium]
MSDVSFVVDYKDDNTLRKSFGKLALEVFGIDFEDYYSRFYFTPDFEGVKYQITSYNDSDDIMFVYPKENVISCAFRHPVTAHA